MMSPRAFGSLYTPITYEEMVEKADLIIIGKNVKEVGTKVEKAVVDEGEFELGYTEWELEVISYLKGNYQGSTITISTPGAKITDEKSGYFRETVGYRIDNTIKSMEEGLVTKVDEILFFLEERNGSYFTMHPDSFMPINLINWKENIIDEINSEDVDPTFIEGTEFLQTYLKETPQYSPDGILLNSKQNFWYYSFIGVIPLSLIIWKFAQRRKVILKSNIQD
ncbi:hypothetical protein [Fredinandcohnia sp. 179-A 10B2 NHS]|uniref:hypothetical protein n=1 Tax=Fredinandcohnia sp. 179-A 10B2 NHS TaxID=3235176 RepID=UPI00399FCC44